MNAAEAINKMTQAYKMNKLADCLDRWPDAEDLELWGQAEFDKQTKRAEASIVKATEYNQDAYALLNSAITDEYDDDMNEALKELDYTFRCFLEDSWKKILDHKDANE